MVTPPANLGSDLTLEVIEMILRVGEEKKIRVGLHMLCSRHNAEEIGVCYVRTDCWDDVCPIHSDQGA